jgi:predicted nucleic acid-binding protein
VILVDTSVWIEHLRRGSARLATLLADAAVLCHPFIVGELACGNLRNRVAVLASLARLEAAPLASHDEVMALVDRHGLAGRGLGLVDVHLLAAARLTPARFWTLDARLAAAAKRLGVAAD